MTHSGQLNAILDSIIPLDDEIRDVQRRIDQVFANLEHIAEVHPAGSWAKKTMLRGRKEADLVLVLARAPDSGTLKSLAQGLADLAGLRQQPDTSRKAVKLAFDDGVSIDVLPVARAGRTPEGDSIPRKLRHALSGIEHVGWYTREAHNTVVHPITRLVKHLKRTNERELGPLSSFSIEAMCVEMRPTGGLEQAFTHLLRELADGWLAPNGRPRRLADPANRALDITEDLDLRSRQQIQTRAKELLRAAEAATWSHVFPSDSSRLPPPASNIGGRTLG